MNMAGYGVTTPEAGRELFFDRLNARLPTGDARANTRSTNPPAIKIGMTISGTRNLHFRTVLSPQGHGCSPGSASIVKSAAAGAILHRRLGRSAASLQPSSSTCRAFSSLTAPRRLASAPKSYTHRSCLFGEIRPGPRYYH